MKHVSILTPLGQTSISNIEGSYQILREVNNLCTSMRRGPLFNIRLVGLSGEAKQTNGLFTVNPDDLIADVPKTDLIIIPALMGEPHHAASLNKEFLPWITDRYNEGAEIVSFCVGSFFLAATGLLNGRQCTTHWNFASQFRAMFPEAHLVDDKIMTEDRGIFTSGGAYAYLNLLLYIIERQAGREIAIFIAKMFMIDIDRNSQSPFRIFQGQKAHQDVPILTAQKYIEEKFEEKITVDSLAAMLAMGRRAMERRFKKATSNTVAEYIQRVKMEAAKRLFESGRKTVNEVMYEVGYSDTKTFRGIFKRITGLSPIDYRNKYNKETTIAIDAV